MSGGWSSGVWSPDGAGADPWPEPGHEPVRRAPAELSPAGQRHLEVEREAARRQEHTSALENRSAPELDLPGPWPHSPGVLIRGGIGGTSALLTDLGDAEGILNGLWETVELIASECSSMISDLGRWADKMRLVLAARFWLRELDPALGADLDWVLLRIRTVGGAAEASAWTCASRAQVLGAELGDLAQALRQARRTYSEAEGTADKLLSAVLLARAHGTRIGNALMPGLNLGSLHTALQTGGLLAVAGGVDRLGHALSKDIGVVDGLAPMSDALIADLAQSVLLATPPGAGPFPPEQAVALLAARLDLVRGAVVGPLSRTAAVTEYVPTDPAERALRPARNLREALDGVEHLYSRHGTCAGTIAVQKNTHADGRITWAVLIPGTQGGLTEGHLFDWESNLRLMANRPAASTGAVELAMEQAGIPPGEDVALFGHSQGGLIAANLAARAGVGGRFAITDVVTAGSPTGALTVPEGVNHLHLETAQDLVPSADGARNPDTPGRTTVVVNPSRVAPADRAEFGPPEDAHAMTTYLEVLALAERSGHPSAQSAIGRVNAVFGRKVHGSDVPGGVKALASPGPDRGSAEVRLFEAHEAPTVRGGRGVREGEPSPSPTAKRRGGLAEGPATSAPRPDSRSAG